MRTKEIGHFMNIFWNAIENLSETDIKAIAYRRSISSPNLLGSIPFVLECYCSEARLGIIIIVNNGKHGSHITTNTGCSSYIFIAKTGCMNPALKRWGIA